MIGMTTAKHDIERILNDWCGAEIAPEDCGDEYRVLCPFHDDTHPSMYVNREEKFYCQACGIGGIGMYKFASLRFGIPGGDWMKILALLFPYEVGNTGSVIPDTPSIFRVKPEVVEERHQANLRAARDYYNGNFHGDSLADTSWKSIDSPGKIYMCKRAFSSKTMQHFHVAAWERFPTHPLLFPCQFNGAVYGYVLKAIEKNAFPRFLTMPGMRKSEQVYGYCPDVPCVALVEEGFTDQYMAWQHGWTEDKYASFDILGSDVSFNQALMMAQQNCVAYISGFDNDEAGEKAHESFVRQMAPFNKYIVRAHWPAKDIALCNKLEFWTEIERVCDEILETRKIGV